MKMLNIEDPTGEPQKWNARNQVIAAHILCAEKNEDEVNAQFGNTYCKEREASRAAGEIQEGRAMKYLPYKSTGVITQSLKRFAQLQKNRLVHQLYQRRHHSIPFWGIHNIYRVLTAPNGAKFTICQVIMSTKCSHDLITPLFVGVNVSPEGDVIIICNIDLKVEAEALLSHFGIYAVVIFGSVVWEAFTVGYKVMANGYQYCPSKNCAVEIDNSTIDSDKSVDREFAKCGFTDNVLVILAEVEFDLPHQITLHLCPDINSLLGDENRDSGTIRSNCSDAIIATSKTAPSNPINYLVPRPTTLIPPPNTVEKETPTVRMTDLTDEADASTISPTSAATS